MRKLRFLSLILIVSTFYTGCENPLTPELEKEFQLKYGKQAFIKDENLRIFFLSVPEDSRCPIDVMCDWAGNAKVVLEFRKGNERKVDTLNTHSGEGFPNRVIFLNYEIILKDLQPYPVSIEETDPKNYVATLIVKKLNDANLQNLFRQWHNSFEEADYPVQLYRPSGFKDFPPARYRKSYIFNRDGSCSWLFLSPNDGHYFVDGHWEYQNGILTIKDHNFEKVEELKIISLTENLFSFIVL